MNRGWSSLYSRASSRRPLVPPPDYSGVLFDNPAELNAIQNQNSEPDAPRQREPENNMERQPQFSENVIPNNDDNGRRDNITLPLPMPEMHGLSDCSPRFPLNKRQNKKYTVEGSCPLDRSKKNPDKTSALNPIAGLLEFAEFDDLLLAGLILMMLECGAERNMILLLGFLLIS
jgi:hypothetical protein